MQVVTNLLHQSHGRHCYEWVHSLDHVSSVHWPDWPRNICHIFTSYFRFSSCSLGVHKMMISQLSSSFPHYSSPHSSICNTMGRECFEELNKLRIVHSQKICMPSDPPFLHSSRFSNAVFQIITCSSLLKCQQTASLACSTFFSK